MNIIIYVFDLLLRNDLNWCGNQLGDRERNL